MPDPVTSEANERPGVQELGSDPAPAEAAGIATRKEFIQGVFRKAEEFTESLLRENERLRYQVLDLTAQLQRGGGSAAPEPGPLRELLSRVETLDAEREKTLVRLRSVQRDSFDFEQRSREIERENNNLANLYIASYQLHSTLDLREITRTLVEILLNFVGARTFAIMLLDEARAELRALASEGIVRERIPPMAIDSGAIGAVVRTGRALVDASAPQSGARVAPSTSYDLDRPLVASPLRIGDKVVGAILIWEFLPQKSELADVDHELLNLLAVHAASAILSAKLTGDLGDRSPALWAAVDLV